MENTQIPSDTVVASMKRRRDAAIEVTLAVVAALVCAYLIYHFFLTKPDIRDNPNGNLVDMIYLDAGWFHKLYVRWTITDWCLTFLAAGTAVSAAIKNAYSTQKAAIDSPSWVDILLIVFAVMTVLATTFDGKLHAAQLAEKYRYGDLHLQTAKFTYAASKKDDDAKAALLTSWREAQAYLESSAVNPTQPGGVAAPANNTGTRESGKSAKAATLSSGDREEPCLMRGCGFNAAL